MQTAELVLAYLRAFLWPTAVLSVVLVFRCQLRDLLARVQHVKAPALEVAFTSALASEVSLQRSLTAVAQQPTGDTEEDIAEQHRRIETLVRRATEWGWRMRAVDDTKPPVPVINWTGDEPVLQNNLDILRILQAETFEEIFRGPYD